MGDSMAPNYWLTSWSFSVNDECSSIMFNKLTDHPGTYESPMWLTVKKSWWLMVVDESKWWLTLLVTPSINETMWFPVWFPAWFLIMDPQHGTWLALCRPRMSRWWIGWSAFRNFARRRSTTSNLPGSSGATVGHGSSMVVSVAFAMDHRFG